MKANKSIHVLAFILGTSLLLSCQEDKLKNEELLNTAGYDLAGDRYEAIIIDASEYNAAVVDDYQIIDGNIEGDSLKLTVQFGGGCGTANFKLLTDGAFMESYPVQLSILLSLKDEDACKALIRRQICFSLTDLADLYQDNYLTDSGTIILRLQDYEDTFTYTF